MTPTRGSSGPDIPGRWRCCLAAIGAVLLAGVAAGCLEVEDQLLIRADGSGSVMIRTTADSEIERMRMAARGMGDGGQMLYPPLNESEARRFFKGQGFEFNVSQEAGAEGARVSTVRVTFKDINELLKTSYGAAHGLQLVRENGKLTLKAVSGLAGATSLEDLPMDEMPMGEIVSPEALKKVAQRPIKFSFKVALPGAVSADGAAVEGHSATWTVDGAALNDKAKTAAALEAVMVASCPDAGVSFTPDSPPRLNLGTFEQLKEGPLAELPKPVDEAKVKAAVKIIPLRLSTTRTFDLAGVGGGENSSTLSLAAVVSREFAPQRWSQARLVEALDEKGNSLGQDDGESHGRMSRYSRMSMGRMREDESPNAESVNLFDLEMRVPPAGSRAIKSVKGELSLLYPGVAHIVKIANAVRPEQIRQDERSVFFMGSGAEQGMSSAAMNALGVKLSLGSASSMYGMTLLMLQLEGGNAAVKDVQVFDKTGKPLPTLMLSGMDMDDNRMIQIAVLGRPEDPLSLGLLVTGGGAQVNVPFEFKDLPLTPNERPAPTSRPDDGPGAIELVPVDALP